MRLQGPKTERRKNSDSRSRHILRRVLLTLATLVLLGLAGMHLLGLITKQSQFNIAEDTVASLLTPVQSGFSSVVESVVNYLYKLKLRANLEIAYNNLKQENEQLVYQAMLADELQKKLTVYEDLYDEISVNESMNPLVATVIEHSSGNYFSVFTINKGSSDGISELMAVTMGNRRLNCLCEVRR